MRSKLFRLHHRKRIQEKRKRHDWVRYISRPNNNEFYSEAYIKGLLVRLYNTPKSCSCYCCCSERYVFGRENKTMQELRELERFKCEE